jgi:hypothetical protein
MSSDNFNAEDQHEYLSWQKAQRRGKVAGGILVVAVGVLFLLRAMEVHIPQSDLIFRWEMILIAVGFISVIKHKFKKGFGFVLMLVGAIFIVKNSFHTFINPQLVWPVLIIIFGIMIIFKPRKRHNHREHWKKFKRKTEFPQHLEDLDSISKDDFIDSVSFFGGVKKNVVSKQFKGADIVTIFGGSEINLNQADFVDKAIIDVTNIFGGMTLIIPSNWQIKSELVSAFAGIEDKRPPHNASAEVSEKILILRGTCIFGGIEINSYN